MSRSSVPRPLRDAVFERDGGHCRYCRLAQLGSGATFHIDHIAPRSRGGTTSLDNLALQCPHCSLHKSDKTAFASSSEPPVPLFHPLRDGWTTHFRLLPDGTCVGLTAIGKATVEALRINAVIPRFARACQIMLGLLTPD